MTNLIQPEPVAWMDREGDLYKMPEIKNWAPPHTMLYTTPPQQQAEPPEWLLIKNILDEYGLQAISFVAEWKAAQQQAEPVSHAVIAGALFDFMGWLTTRKERLVLSSTDNASPAVESITEFAKMRGLSLDDAKVQDWNTSLPQQQAEPVEAIHIGWDYLDNGKLVATYAVSVKEQTAPHLYTTPPQRQWVGLTDEDLEFWTGELGQGELGRGVIRAVADHLKERNHD